MEHGYLGYRILALLFLTFVNAFFSAAEVALLSVRLSRMQAQAAEGNIGAQAAVTLMTNMERMISLCQVGITLASLGMGWAGEEAIYGSLVDALKPMAPAGSEWLLRGGSFVVSFLLLTLVLVILGEVVPKNLAVEQAERMAVLTSPALLVCYRVLEPFVFGVERLSARVSRLFGLRGIQHSGGHSAEEIKHIVAASRDQGHLGPFEEDSINRLLDLHSLAAREVMVPRADVASVGSDASLDDVLKLLADTNYSRMPVYRERPENIVGIVHSRDLVRVWRDRRLAQDRGRAARPFRLEDWMRKPLVVPETKPLSELVDQFRQSHGHMAVVVDEFGSITGVITLEDVLEQVFGEIEDEHDARRLPLRPEAPVIEVEGTIPIVDLEAHYGIELPADAGFETLAGFLLSRLGVIPEGGEAVVESDRRYTILKMERHRIASVRIERIDPAVADPAARAGSE